MSKKHKSADDVTGMSGLCALGKDWRVVLSDGSQVAVANADLYIREDGSQLFSGEDDVLYVPVGCLTFASGTRHAEGVPVPPPSELEDAAPSRAR